MFFMQFIISHYNSLLQDTLTIKSSHGFRRQLDIFVRKNHLGPLKYKTSPLAGEVLQLQIACDSESIAARLPCSALSNTFTLL